MNREIIPKLKVIIGESVKEAREMSDVEVRPEHIISSIINDNNNGCVEALRLMGIDLLRLNDSMYLELTNNNNLTPRVKKVVEHKESTTKKPTAMALAKEIRKDGESWKEAVKRASSEMKKGTTETKKAVVETKKATITEMQKLLKFVKRRKELKNISGTNLQRDASRSAKPSGKRTSKEGNVYYENRENRTDRLAPNYPKGAPKLANGGFMDGVYAEDRIREIAP